MSGDLQHVEDDGARCVHCGALAVGPCASCSAPLCGDCCIIEKGPAKAWAVCKRCAGRGTTVGRAWQGLAVWLGGLLLGLLVLTLAVGWLASR